MPYLKSVHIRSLSGPYFPASGLSTERYGVSLCIHSDCGKIRTIKTPNMDAFHAVIASPTVKRIAAFATFSCLVFKVKFTSNSHRIYSKMSIANVELQI